jgi:ketol-acid reductoisomerase
MSNGQIQNVELSYFKNKIVAILGHGDNGKAHAH